MPRLFTFHLNSLISWLLKLSMFGLSVDLFVTGEPLLGIFGFAALAISLIPAAVGRSHDTNLPWPIDFWLTLWLALSVAGSAGLYRAYPWWDDMLHFGGSAVLAYLAFVLIYALSFVGKLKLTIPFIGFFTFLVGMAFGALWELSEYWAWQLTGRDALTGTGDLPAGLLDTFSDLQLDLLGSVIIALGGMVYIAYRRHINVRAWMEPFFKIFGREVQRARRRFRNKLQSK